ncbi:MAG: copper-binding protein [Burkholderiales bacterium]
MTRNSLVIAMLVLGAGLAFQSGANSSENQLAKKEAKPAVVAGVVWTDGEVARVEKAAGTVTIKHGAMPKFDMPPMTMPYKVKDKGVLDQLKPGDKIRFDVDGVGGVFTVTHLEKLK